MTPDFDCEAIYPRSRFPSAQDYAVRASPYLLGVIYVALICSVAVRVYLLAVYHVPFPWLNVGFEAVVLVLLHLRFASFRAEKRESVTLNR